MSDTAKWYVIHTYSGYENKVATSILNAVENRKLQDLFSDVKVPTEMVMEINKDNKKKEVEHKIFPGYVLVKMIMTDDSWYVVRNIRGVTGFVGPGSKPVPLTDEEVIRLGIELDENTDEPVKSNIRLSYKVGDSVKVMSGYLAGFIGTVNEIDLENQVVKVTVSVMTNDTLVELGLDQVQNLE